MKKRDFLSSPEPQKLSNLPLKIDLHDDTRQVGVDVLLNGATLELFCHVGLNDCQTCSKCIEVILHRSIEVVESVVVLQHPMRERTLLLVNCNKSFLTQLKILPNSTKAYIWEEKNTKVRTRFNILNFPALF